MTVPDGAKERLHKHIWRVAAGVSCKKLNKYGMVMDFNKLNGMLEDVVAELSNRKLGEIKYLKKSQSAEKLAQYIFEKMRKKLPGKIRLDFVEVMEHSGFYAKIVS